MPKRQQRDYPQDGDLCLSLHLEVDRNLDGYIVAKATYRRITADEMPNSVGFYPGDIERYSDRPDIFYRSQCNLRRNERPYQFYGHEFRVSTGFVGCASVEELAAAVRHLKRINKRFEELGEEYAPRTLGQWVKVACLAVRVDFLAFLDLPQQAWRFMPLKNVPWFVDREIEQIKERRDKAVA